MHTGMLIAHRYATFLWALKYNNLVGQLTSINDMLVVTILMTVIMMMNQMIDDDV